MKTKAKNERRKAASDAYYDRRSKRRGELEFIESDVIYAVLNLYSSGERHWPSEWAKSFFNGLPYQMEEKCLSPRQRWAMWRFLGDEELEDVFPQYTGMILLANFLIEDTKTVCDEKAFDGLLQDARYIMERAVNKYAEHRESLIDQSHLAATPPATEPGDERSE